MNGTNLMTPAYKIVYDAVVINPDSNISPAALQAVLELVKYAEDAAEGRRLLGNQIVGLALHVGIEIPEGMMVVDVIEAVKAKYDAVPTTFTNVNWDEVPTEQEGVFKRDTLLARPWSIFRSFDIVERDGDKTTFEWWFMDNKGNAYAIWDFDEAAGGDVNNESAVNWTIAAKDSGNVDAFKAWVIEQINS